MLRATLQRSSLLAILTASTLAMGSCDAEPFSPATPELDVPSTEMLAVQASASSEAFLRLYARNIFVGASTRPLFDIDFSQFPGNIGEVVAAAQFFWGEVQVTDFPVRAEALADEIAATQPHVVGLNEVAAFAVVDLGTGLPVEGVDFLPVLMDALAARGLDYVVQIDQVATSSQLPYALGPTGVTQILTFQVGDAVLVRGDLEVTDQANALYGAGLDLGPVQVGRGWSRVSFPFKGVTHHVVVTHLEQQILLPIQNAQATELIEVVLAGLEGPTFVVGDLNSDANNGPGAPTWTPTYGRMLDAGFVDPWLEKTGRAASGETCCWDDDLIGGMLDQRNDFILARVPEAGKPNAKGKFLAGVVQMEIFGDEESDRIPSLGIFPADHAGLFGAFNIPRGLITDR
jgi:endonuclease/exonuclease/phosphatase family metal-dependent hydrolase